MKEEPVIQPGPHFMSGNEACAEGALAAGCRFFAGYPITPSTEIAEHLAERLPELGGIFIQMEDEMAAVNAVLGATWGGLKGMTATSGPGFSLMMENIGLAVMTETPCVIVDVQRGGPSTGLATKVGQGDMMQAKWGSHGSYEIIALSPSSPQEFFEQTIKAFNLAEEFRNPVIILADEVVGHMSEKVIFPDKDKLQIISRKYTSLAPADYHPYDVKGNGIPEMVKVGDGYRIHVTGSTHDFRGYPFMTAEAQANLIPRLVEKVRSRKSELVDVKELDGKGAEVLVCAYGITARTSYYAIEQARTLGMKVGLLKLNVVWPFPEEVIRKWASRVKAIVVPEINMGQMVLEVERAAAGKCKVVPVFHPGGDIHRPQDILDAIKKSAT